MQITACKNQQNQSTISKDIGDFLFYRALEKSDNNQLKQHDNTVASMDV